jgi:hypothetical protein
MLPWPSLVASYVEYRGVLYVQVPELIDAVPMYVPVVELYLLSTGVTYTLEDVEVAETYSSSCRITNHL